MIEPISLKQLECRLGDGETPKKGFFAEWEINTLNEATAEGRNFIVVDITTRSQWNYIYYVVFCEVDARKKKGEQ